METDKNNNKLKINNSSQVKEKVNSRIEKKNTGRFMKLVNTNLYLNEYNYYFKNIIKMNKIRQEKIRENKKKAELAQKKNLLPKMLYFNKFLNDEEKKNVVNRQTINSNINKINKARNLNNFQTECISSENRPIAYKKIEKAIIAKNIEEHNKSHIKKTIKAFDDLIKYVDNFEFQDKKPNLNLIIDTNNQRYFSDLLNEKINDDKDEEEIIKVENYNFEEYKKNYRNAKAKLNKKNPNSNINLKKINSQENLNNNYSEDFKKVNDNIYITTSTHLNKENNQNQSNQTIQNNTTNNEDKSFQINEVYNSFDANNINNKSDISKPKKNKLIINNMTLISDDALIDKIKNIGRDFKNGLYFNEYGKFKFTELGLNYPNSVDKFKKIPDYKGTDVEEKKLFKYKSTITNPKYNYTNIGTFNEKFNHDLADISTYYGKEYSKGRFLRNPLVSKYSKYIPNYAQYKDLKSIENIYIIKNKYKFRLKPLINNKKGNFDKLANNVYKREHKNDSFMK